MAVRVLLVDDVPDVRRRVRAALVARGEHVVVGEAADGAAGLELARSLQPDIVVLDLSLPDLAGQQIVSGLREHAPQAKVVVYSGASPDDAEAVEDPVDPDDRLEQLLELVQAAARKPGVRAARVLSPTLDSARAGREFARTTLSDWGLADVLDDTLLIVSELVSNAVKHGTGDCELSLLRGSEVLRIEVCDRGSGSPDPLPPSSSRPFGRGLNLIDALVHAWGVEPLSGGGKIVWAELTYQRPTAATAG